MLKKKWNVVDTCNGVAYFTESTHYFKWSADMSAAHWNKVVPGLVGKYHFAYQVRRIND